MIVIGAANSADVTIPNFAEYDNLKAEDPFGGYTVDMVFVDTVDPTQDTVVVYMAESSWHLLRRLAGLLSQKPKL